eukprot:gene7636-10187_t
MFCGLGPFTLRLAETARVYAADADRAGIAALQLAVRNTRGLKPVTAQMRDLFREPLVPTELTHDVVVFDPPRAGAEAQSRELAKSKVKTIVAVSCEPKTFARDAAILIAGGYRLEKVTPVDQFAWSAHVELFFDPVQAAQFPKLTLRYRNQRAARSIGIDDLTDAQWLEHFGRFVPIAGSFET